MKGNPYPVILINNVGIVQTAELLQDWQIINF